MRQVPPAGSPALNHSQWPDAFRRFVEHRGLSQEQVNQRLAPKLSQLLDPFSLKSMQRAVDRLVLAHAKQESVCIYADFDLDGTSGLALLYEGLLALGFRNLSYYQPKRLAEGYGFHTHAVQALAEKSVRLIVTVDVGITAIAAVEAANTIGLEVIVTDHHQPAAQLPQALAVVNPNQPGDQSGLGYLCGAGVAFYLLRAVRRGLENAGVKTVLDLKDSLDFLTIATLTDMVPLEGDNIPLVKHGLIALTKTTRPGLRLLMESLKLHQQPLTAQDVAIRMAPKLNALSRMENGLLPVDLFLEKSKDKVRGMVELVLANNEDRIELQAHGEAEARERLKDWTDKDFVFVSSPNFHRGVIGLIATKLSQSHNCPAFVGSESLEDGTSERLIVGSARIPSKDSASALLALTAAGSVLNRYGGHHAAAGFELRSGQTDAFIETLRAHFATQSTSGGSLPKTPYDEKLSAWEVDADLMQWLEALGPYGVGFEVPVFRLDRLQVTGFRRLKDIHWKLNLESVPHPQAPMGKVVAFEALYFSVPTHLRPPDVGDQISILGELQWNYFAGSKRLQILVRDLLTLETRFGAEQQ